MIIKRANLSVQSKQINDIYKKSFPKKERYPFCVLKSCTLDSNVVLDTIQDNDKIIGFIYYFKNGGIIYIFYFAIDEKLRNRGYGSRALKSFLKEYHDYKIILSIENPDNIPGSITTRRKDFYLRSGLYVVGKKFKERDILFEILCNDPNFIITNQILKDSYCKISPTTAGGKFLKKLLIKANKL